MHPALSVLLLTTLIGAGQGLFLALFTIESYSAFGLLPRVAPTFLAQGSAVALVFLAAGLGASFFHLGHPERAWRAAAMWRTSWLSREVIALPAFMGALFVYGALHFCEINPVLGQLPSGAPIELSAVVGSVATVLAFVLFVCTAMIYASLRFLREWHSPLTVINYILLGGASGFALAAGLATLWSPGFAAFFAGWAVVLTVAGLIGRVASLIRNARLKPKSTLQTAIGIKHPRIVQKSQGAMGGSFNTREFFHGQPTSRLASIKWVFLLTAFALPTALFAANLANPDAASLFLAFAVQFAGLLLERWFFFAQANHPQNLYYQCVS